MSEHDGTVSELGPVYRTTCTCGDRIIHNRQFASRRAAQRALDAHLASRLRDKGEQSRQCVTCKTQQPIHAYGQCATCHTNHEDDITLTGGEWVFSPRRRIHQWQTTPEKEKETNNDNRINTRPQPSAAAEGGRTRRSRSRSRWRR